MLAHENFIWAVQLLEDTRSSNQKRFFVFVGQICCECLYWCCVVVSDLKLYWPWFLTNYRQLSVFEIRIEIDCIRQNKQAHSLFCLQTNHIFEKSHFDTHKNAHSHTDVLSLSPPSLSLSLSVAFTLAFARQMHALARKFVWSHFVFNANSFLRKMKQQTHTFLVLYIDSVIYEAEPLKIAHAVTPTFPDFVPRKHSIFTQHNKLIIVFAKVNISISMHSWCCCCMLIIMIVFAFSVSIRLHTNRMMWMASAFITTFIEKFRLALPHCAIYLKNFDS